MSRTSYSQDLCWCLRLCHHRRPCRHLRSGGMLVSEGHTAGACADLNGLPPGAMVTSRPGYFQGPCLGLWSYHSWYLYWSPSSVLPPKVAWNCRVWNQAAAEGHVWAHSQASAGVCDDARGSCHFKGHGNHARWNQRARMSPIFAFRWPRESRPWLSLDTAVRKLADSTLGELTLVFWESWERWSHPSPQTSLNQPWGHGHRWISPLSLQPGAGPGVDPH